jgi:hypothetical protein
MVTWRIDITLEEPFSTSGRAAVSNEIETEEAIPATTLRGALAAAMRRGGRENQQESWFAGPSPRFTDALPMVGEKIAVPMPLCFVRDKADRGAFDGWFGVFNTLFRGVRELPELLGHRRHQWTRLGEEWLLLERDGSLADVFEQDLEISMHVGLHYQRQSVRGSALYSRMKVAKGSRFIAWVEDEQGVIQDAPDRVLLGKRRTAGNGAAQLQWTRLWDALWERKPPHACRQQHTVQLLSDALLPCTATGGMRRTVIEADLSGILENPKIVRRESDVGMAAGFNGQWRLPRPPVPAVKAGSVFLVEADQVHCSGPWGWIGARNHEGFGWVAVDPPWLAEGQDGEPIHRPYQPALHKHLEMTQLWPGAESLGLVRQRELVAQADQLAQSLGGERARVQFLLTAAQRVNSIVDWRDQLNHYRHLQQWDTVRKQLSPLADTHNLESLRFLLEMVLTYLPKEQAS